MTAQLQNLRIEFRCPHMILDAGLDEAAEGRTCLAATGYASPVTPGVGGIG